MKFILYSRAYPYDTEELPSAANYNGISLRHFFSLILCELGEVIAIDHPDDALQIHAQCVANNETCLLFSFLPPQLTPVALPCPVIPVFAWEYPNLPEQIEERCWQADPRHDWRFVLSGAKGAIVLSAYARDAVRRSMGATYPVAAAPWPLSQQRHDEPADIRSLPNASTGAILSIHATVADSEQMGLSADAIVCEDDDDAPPLDPADMIDLPALDLSARRLRTIPPENPAASTLVEPGLVSPPACALDLPPVVAIRTRLRGIVYAAVLSPSLEQDNWEDLISGFCWSFADAEDATLVLIIEDPEPAACQARFVSLLTRLSPFKTRVLAMYGLPSADEYAALIRATTYYVNTSKACGSSRYLADFMAAGVPAIAPAHTGLSDLIHPDCAFVIRSAPGVPRPWPHGDHDIYRTSWHQIDWQSLVDAFCKSHALATEDPAAYLSMAHAARKTARARCGDDAIKNAIRQFLHDIGARGTDAHGEQQVTATMTPGRDHDTARLHQHCR